MMNIYQVMRLDNKQDNQVFQIPNYGTSNAEWEKKENVWKLFSINIFLIIKKTVGLSKFVL